MKMIWPLIAFLLLEAGSGSGPASALDLSRPGLREAVSGLEARVPAVEGRVISRVDSLLYLDVGSAAGLREGTELTVFREGESILHPLTRQVLGRFENVLGVVRVKETSEGYVTGELVMKGGETIVPGDRVRISSHRLRILVLSVPGLPPGDRRRLRSMVFGVLEDSPRLQPLDPAGGREVFLPAAGGERVAMASREGADLLLGMEIGGSAGEEVLRLLFVSGRTGEAVAGEDVPLLAEAPAGGAASAVPDAGSGVIPPDARQPDMPAAEP